MSVFVKRQTHDIQKMKSFNQQSEQSGYLFVITLVYVTEVHNDVRLRKKLV